MTPGARVAAAIEVLDAIAEDLAAEQALTRWARQHRFAGSKDRAAIRDHVFDVLRNRRTAEHLGQGTTGRALMIGRLHASGDDLDALFSGEGHAPPPLTEAERDFPPPPEARAVRWNLPDWLVPHFEQSLGQNAEATAALSAQRALVGLRVNTAKATRPEAQEMLSKDGVTTRASDLCPTALVVTEGARRIRNGSAYTSGIVELQDAASQAVVCLLPEVPRYLDYCAGGGGKALALAARSDAEVSAHDRDPRRMRDLPARAARAGATVHVLQSPELDRSGSFGVVLCDAPCSGSGAWRRAPEGKWLLTPERLKDLCAIQDDILDQARQRVGEGGTLAYATCSLLSVENEDRVAAFLARHDGWTCTLQRRIDLGPENDGFFTAHFRRR